MIKIITKGNKLKKEDRVYVTKSDFKKRHLFKFFKKSIYE